jgi:hypothetical protein
MSPNKRANSVRQCNLSFSGILELVPRAGGTAWVRVPCFKIIAFEPG